MPAFQRSVFRAAAPAGAGYHAAVPDMETTSWGLIESAAQGEEPSVAAFARRYQAFVREVLGIRWRGSRLLLDVDDAVQEVFVECFRQGGGLQRADSSRGTQFRAFLAGIVRNVALRFEAGRNRNGRDGTLPEDGVVSRDNSVSHQLDRAWMKMILQRAGERFRVLCADDGQAGRRRWEVLRLRFEESLPVRTIAARLGVTAEAMHVEYRRARRQFRACLEQELAMHGDSAEGIARLWRELLELL